MATYEPPKRATEYIFYVGLVSQVNTKLLQVTPTLAAGDVQISKDGGAFANLTTLPVVTPAANRSVKVTLSATEMTADNVAVFFSDAAGAEWCDLFINIQTAARQIDDLAFPVVSGRGLDVTATGAAGIDWANIENPATAQNLSATNIDVDQVVASVSGAVGSVTGAVGSVAAGGITAASFGAGAIDAAAIANGAIDAATFAAGAIDAAAIAADAIGSSELAASAVDEIVNAVWDELTAEARTVGSYGQLVKDDINATISSRASQASVDAVQADTDDIQTRLPAALVGGRIDASVGAMAAGTVTAAAIATDAIDADALATDGINEIADGLLNRNMATGTDSGTETVRTVRQALRILRNKVDVPLGTVYKEDDAIASWTFTKTTDAAALPLTVIDPDLSLMAGYTSLSGKWIGGFSSSVPPPPVLAGYRSLFMFWLGGLGGAGSVIPPVAEETFSGGWERHPYIRGPKRVRFKFKDEEIPAPVVEIVESLAAQITPDTLDRDLEIALRLRLRNQEIVYRSIYLLLLEQEFRRIKTRQRQENEAVELLLLH